jgi:hypothetical protein
MEWYRQVQFIAAVPMPEDAAEELGTTINGMWAAPEARPDSSVARAHANGQRVLFSVPLIALVPDIYKNDAGRHLLGEVCRDIEGSRAVVGWYYWESEPVYAACIYSPVWTCAHASNLSLRRFAILPGSRSRPSPGAVGNANAPSAGR